jgi:hypothetical protein
MRYLIRAKLKPGKKQALLNAIDTQTLGQGSIAGDEYFRNMGDARLYPDQNRALGRSLLLSHAFAGRKAVLGRVLRSNQDPGRPRPPQMPR